MVSHPAMRLSASRSMLCHHQRVAVMQVRQMSKKARDTSPVLLTSTTNGVTTLQMNRPSRLNAWTGPMMNAIFEEFEKATADENTKAIILTGSGRYYCAGVDLGSTLKPMMPKTLHGLIVKQNQKLFDTFLDFPKPVFVAVNGPAVGASVTSATLTDGVIALDLATFSTPFSSLGICPEGCSSENFETIMGAEAAERMLGPEGWKPTALEWQELGVVQEVVAAGSEEDNSQQLLAKAQEYAEQWVQAEKPKRLSEEKREELKKVNALESIKLATCFLDYPFLEGQYQFAHSKGKSKVANLFWTLKTTRPLWSMML